MPYMKDNISPLTLTGPKCSKENVISMLILIIVLLKVVCHFFLVLVMDTKVHQ